ncbi:MAG TPA: tetratricopeptide repeat protein [Chlamydiales bacterium]|nr:tetratricopeptide repeat protein [Chlamydiales bacterium]
MTLQAHPLRRIFARFFPRKVPSPILSADASSNLSHEQKKELALHYLYQGEMSLLQGNLNALSLFEAASNLDTENPQVWYRQGLSFFEYGSEEGKEKALLLAGKNFKIATQVNSQFFDAWVAWGNVLLQLGRFHEEHHFHLEAKEKYQKALALSEGQSKEVLAELYWDYGIVWSEIAQHSGEALDVRLAIDAFQTSKNYQEKPSPEFWNDCGKAYLEMGLLVNDPRLYLQSIDYLQRAIAASPHYFDGWMSLAEGYSQLYINTMDERYVAKASDAFACAAKMSPRDPEVWLGWGQLLGETGRLNNDTKSLRLSIEKCARGATIEAKNPLIISQWVESLSHLGAITSRLDLLIEAEHKILKATDLFPDDPDLWHAYGICLISFGRYYEDPEYFEMAIEKLQYGLSIDRTDAELWHALGVTHKLYADLTDETDLIERSNRFLAKAMDLKPSCPSLTYDTASALLMYSDMIDESSSLEQSLSLIESLLQNHKEAILRHPEWLFEYASALESLGDMNGEQAPLVRAVEIFSHILLIDPDFPCIHHRIAQCYTHLGHIAGDAEFHKRAIHFFRLAVRQDEENDAIWLDWGLCLIHLAHHTLDTEFMDQLYMDAEQKISRAGHLGNEGAYYNLACLYSILGRTQEAMDLIRKALAARALPPIDDLVDDEWLDNLRATESFAQFLTALEAKLQQTREE